MTMLIVGVSGHVGNAVAQLAVEKGIATLGLSRTPAIAVNKRVRLFSGDARRTNLGLDSETAEAIAADVTSIVVATGGFDLSISLAQAQSEHIAPLRGALRFAEQCPRLRTVVLVSSLLAPGHVDQRLRSDLLPEQPKHRNFYEWAKLAGERIATASKVPVDIVRAGHVVVDNDTDRRSQPQALFELFPLMASGWPLPVVGSNRYWSCPADFAAQVIVDRAEHGSGGSSVWAVDPASPTYSDIFDLVNARYGLRVKRIRHAALARVAAAVIRPSWLDLTVNREVLDYTDAVWDLELRCLQDLIDQRRVTAPADRDYLVRAIDYEFTRLTERLP